MSIEISKDTNSSGSEGTNRHKKCIAQQSTLFLDILSVPEKAGPDKCDNSVLKKDGRFV